MLRPLVRKWNEIDQFVSNSKRDGTGVVANRLRVVFGMFMWIVEELRGSSVGLQDLDQVPETFDWRQEKHIPIHRHSRSGCQAYQA